MVTALRLSGLLPHVVKYLPTSEKAALPGDLELKRIGARDLFKEVGGGACSIFKEKESIMGIYYTLDLGGCQRKRSTLLLRGRYCKPVVRLHVFCSNCLPSRGSSALEQPHQQWDAFPLSHHSQPDPQILLSQGVTSLPSGTFPGSCKPEGTAVSAVSDSAASAASKVAVKRLRWRCPGC